MPSCVNSKDDVINKAWILEKKIILEQKKSSKRMEMQSWFNTRTFFSLKQWWDKEIKGSLIFLILVVKETEKSIFST